MARLARVVVPGMPHHIIQRGNRRQQAFFCDADYHTYLELLHEWCTSCNVEIWGYCLMPNHIHLLAVPGDAAGLRRAIGEAHRRYTRQVNFRERWRGHLWQGRFGSFVMDVPYLLAAARYVELNPVRAGLVRRAGDYPWSSARAHLDRADDVLVKVAPLLKRMPDWAAFLNSGPSVAELTNMRQHERTGRPLGAGNFLEKLETQLGRVLRRIKPGPKAANTEE